MNNWLLVCTLCWAAKAGNAQHIDGYPGLAGGMHVGVKTVGNTQPQVIGQQCHIAQAGKQQAQPAFSVLQNIERRHIQFGRHRTMLVHQTGIYLSKVVRNDH